MDMLETYLGAVAAQLPRDMADDIVAELRDTLLSQVEEREEVLGRPLTDEEREELLRAMGHPLVVAARYRKGPQMLIGPDLFPYWLFAVKAGLVILAALYALTLLIALISNPFGGGRSAIQSLHGLFGTGVTLIGAVTIAGAICEHFGLRPPYLDTWRVKDLQLLKIGDPAAWAAQVKGGPNGASVPGGGRTFFGMPRPQQLPRRWPGSQAMLSLVAGLIFVAWWVGLLRFPGLARFDLDGMETVMEPAAMWAALYLPILVYALVQIGVDAIGVLRPTAVRLRAVLQIPVAIAGMTLAWTILRGDAWFTLVRGSTRATVGGYSPLLSFQTIRALDIVGFRVQAMAANLHVIITWALIITLASLAVKVLKSLWQLVRSRRVA